MRQAGQLDAYSSVRYIEIQLTTGRTRGGVRMGRRLRQHLSFANVISAAALFVALGGVSYAITLPKNSVDSKQIEQNAVGAAEIRRSAIRSDEVADFSLRIQDFDTDALPEGPQGPIGPPGVTGPPGADATKLFAYIRDPASAGPPVVQYGSGVTGVSRDGVNTYTVTFNRNLTACVALANTGIGNPPFDPFDPGSDAETIAAIPEVVMDNGPSGQVEVTFTTIVGQSPQASFLIAAFC
jgi:hypothetical protein